MSGAEGRDLAGAPEEQDLDRQSAAVLRTHVAWLTDELARAQGEVRALRLANAQLSEDKQTIREWQSAVESRHVELQLELATARALAEQNERENRAKEEANVATMRMELQAVESRLAIALADVERLKRELQAANGQTVSASADLEGVKYELQDTNEQNLQVIESPAPAAEVRTSEGTCRFTAVEAGNESRVSEAAAGGALRRATCEQRVRLKAAEAERLNQEVQAAEIRPVTVDAHASEATYLAAVAEAGAQREIAEAERERSAASRWRSAAQGRVEMAERRVADADSHEDTVRQAAAVELRATESAVTEWNVALSGAAVVERQSLELKAAKRHSTEAEPSSARAGEASRHQVTMALEHEKLSAKVAKPLAAHADELRQELEALDAANGSHSGLRQHCEDRLGVLPPLLLAVADDTLKDRLGEAGSNGLAACSSARASTDCLAAHRAVQRAQAEIPSCAQEEVEDQLGALRLELKHALAELEGARSQLSNERSKVRQLGLTADAQRLACDEPQAQTARLSSRSESRSQRSDVESMRGAPAMPEAGGGGRGTAPSRPSSRPGTARRAGRLTDRPVLPTTTARRPRLPPAGMRPAWDPTVVPSCPRWQTDPTVVPGRSHRGAGA